MKNEELENITPKQIIDFANSKTEVDLSNIKPTEILKTKYTFGQTIILKGNKRNFNNIINFWLVTQTWYGSDGEDSFFEKLIFDNLKKYSSWQKEPNRVGICQIATQKEKQAYNNKITRLINLKIEQGYLIMNPTWNEEKVLFMDDDNYYLYYFWTGE